MRFAIILFFCAIVSKTPAWANNSAIFHSQAAQDEFVYTLLYELSNKQDAGYYLEIGAGEPLYLNNTYAFEKYYAWKGLSIDISENLIYRWQAERDNPLLSQDATQLDYTSILCEFPQVIDYLSLDVDGYYDLVLEKVLQSGKTFKIITIEHDAYRYGDVYRTKERDMLSEHGYQLVCPNVSHNGYVFEDWWVKPEFFPSAFLQALFLQNVDEMDCREVLQTVKISVANGY